MRTLGAGLGATILNQDIYEISATAKHRLGTRCVRGESVYRYAKAGAAITDNARGCHPLNRRQVRCAVIPATGARAVGANQVLVTVNADDGLHTQAAGGDGSIAAHILQGGHIILMPATNSWLTFGILDNAAKAAGAGTMLVTLDGELPVALVLSGTCKCEEIVGNQYRDVLVDNNSDLLPHVGVPMRLLTVAEPYGWIKTWGPMRVSPQGDVGLHSASEPQARVVFRHDGSVDTPKAGTSRTEYQHAGYAMTNQGNDGGWAQTAPFIFLQLSP